MTRVGLRTKRVLRAPLAAAILAACACGNGGPGTPSSDAGLREDDAAPSTVPASPPGGPEAGTYADFVRRGDWSRAEAELAKLAEPERNAPEIRYLRARVAAHLGRGEEVHTWLAGLESALPLLAASIRAARADARLATECPPPNDCRADYLDAAVYYASIDNSASLSKAARAFELAGDTERARRAADRVVALSKHTRAEEASARALRIRQLSKGSTDKARSKAALADARWISVNTPDLPEAKDAQEFLTTGGQAKFSQEEWVVRARAWTAARVTDEAIKAVDHAMTAHAGGHPIAKIDLCHVRAEAYFKARNRYPEAAATYARCAAQTSGELALEDRFLEARSLARADRDDEAIVIFHRLFEQHKSSHWGQEGLFHSARLHFLHGRPAKAAELFDRYMDTFPKGKENREAQRYRALAHYWNHNLRVARQAFEQLVSDPDPDVSLRATNLAALSAYEDGDVLFARSRWRSVVKAKPLSYPALVAQARLARAGDRVPLLEGAEGRPHDDAPLQVTLPDAVALLHRLGLDDEAERALQEREGVITQRARGRETEALCEAYAQLGRGERRYQLSASLPAALFERAPNGKNTWAWRCAYPTPFTELVQNARSKSTDAADRPPPAEPRKSDATSVDEALIYGVMRTESAFQERVVSPARAVGLLQLLPETARSVAGRHPLTLGGDGGTAIGGTTNRDGGTATGGTTNRDGGGRQLGCAPSGDCVLTDAAVNIPLGVLYLQELAQTTKQSEVLSVASYNAGPDAVVRWARRLEKLPLDVWVEAIPFTETRAYVSRVLGARAHYTYLTGGLEAEPAFPFEMPHF